ncbi:MAG: hypothetical protein ED555_02475 [Allomuricauda sp.]|nr:MAG: hypothetical protein ED555_02475 [Allomuricauda sp.]
MKTSEFLSLLQDHKEKSLVFEYQPGKLVPANYHITEVKNITVDSVDCGARTDFWKETIIQLWESPSEIGKTEFMSALKALGILNKVDRMKPMTRDAEIKFEYSNAHFHTAQLFVNGFGHDTDRLVFNLGVQKTDCKAKEECGVPLTSNVEDEACCSPSSGCC